MAKQIINIGAKANDKSGDTARVWAAKTNANFNELYQQFATVNGNQFTIRKTLGNTTLGVFEPGDVALNGFWDANEFWKIAIFIGGDENVKTNWNIIESL